MAMIRTRYTPALCATILLLGGCSSEPGDRPSVRGTILVKDARGVTAPLPEGLITFEPVDSTPGPKVSQRIEQGNYNIDAAAGLRPGRYRIEVYAMPPEIVAALQGASPEHEQTFREVDSRFNSQSTLYADLTPGAEHTVDAEVAYRAR